MGTSIDLTQVERSQQQLQSMGKELEKLGCENILITVYEDHHTVFASQKGKLFLEKHWNFVIDFSKCCEAHTVVKSESLDVKSDADDRAKITTTNNQSETNTADLNCSYTLNTPKPLDNGDDLFDGDTDEADIDVTVDALYTALTQKESSTEEQPASKTCEKRKSRKTASPRTNKRTRKTRGRQKDDLTNTKLPSCEVLLQKTQEKESDDDEKNVRKRLRKRGIKTEPRQKAVKTEPRQRTVKTELRKRTVKTEPTEDRPVTAKFKCNICQVNLPSQELLKTHLDSHIDLKCGYCRKECQSESELIDHKKEHLVSDVCFECTLCETKIYKFEWQLKQHIEKEHNDNKNIAAGNFPCCECGYVFKFQNHLDEHKQVLKNCKHEASAKEKERVFLETVTNFTDPTSGELKTRKWKEFFTERDYPATCEICLKTLPVRMKYQRHIWSHAEFKPHKCFICSRDYKFEEDLQKHLKVHDQRPFHCKHCHFKFDTEARRDHHVRMTCTKLKDKPDLVCKICGHQFNSVFKLNDHQMLHTGETPWTCDECIFSAPTKAKLTRHKRVCHMEVLPFKCEQCGLMFKSNLSIQIHMKSHVEKRFECEVCGKKLMNESNLARHIQKAHKEKRTFPCDQCGAVFYRPVRLKDHMRRHTGEKPYTCETCGMSFFRKGRLAEHIRTHTGEKPYPCKFPDCGKWFSTFSSLRVHRTIHNPNRCYVCDVCGRTFKNESHLQYHRKNHTTDWRWPCMYCEQKYKSIAMYKTHLARVHPDMKDDIERRTPIRLHKCELCSKMYSDGQDLRRHILIHKGLKPFKCSYCDKAFNDKSNLKCHERIHTGDVRLHCNYCSKGFIHQRALRLHLHKVHRQKMEMKAEEPVEQKTYTVAQESAVAVDNMLQAEPQDLRQRHGVITEALHQSVQFGGYKPPLEFTLDQQAMVAEPLHPSVRFQEYKPTPYTAFTQS